MDDELDKLGITALKKIAKEEGIPRYSTFNSSNKHELVRLIREKRQIQQVPQPFTSQSGVPESERLSIEEIYEAITEIPPDMEKIAQIFTYTNPKDEVILDNGNFQVRKALIQIINEVQPDLRVLDYVLSLKSVKINDEYDEGETLLFDAVIHQKEDNIKFLLEHGADPRFKGDFGVSPFIRSIDLPKISLLLLSHGGDPNDCDDMGRTVLTLAIRANNRDLVKALIRDKRTKISPEIDYLITSAHIAGENKGKPNPIDQILLSDRRFYSHLFDMDRAGEDYLNVKAVYMKNYHLFYSEEGSLNEYVFLDIYLKQEIVKVKRIISKSLVDNPRDILDPIELISVYDTVLDDLRENLNHDHGGSRNIVVPIFLDPFDTEWRLQQCFVEISEIETDNKESFFDFSHDRGLSTGAVYSYNVPDEVKTAKGLVQSFGLAGHFLNFYIEGEVVNDSEIEIEDGIVVEITLKPNLAKNFH